jgi:TPP-dependent 2-oxoacid decarboxylase
MLKHLQIGNFDREYLTQATATNGETVASYLNKRLQQICVSHVFCTTGDYLAEWAATLDEPRINAGLIRVNLNNEMCGTYAAEGYGRATNQTVCCVAFTYV